MEHIGWESYVGNNIGLYYIIFFNSMVWYGTVRIVSRTEEEKYGTDIWVVLLHLSA